MQASLSDVREQYMSINKRIQPLTRDLTKRAFGYMIDVLGNIPIGRVGYKDAERFQAHLSDSGLSNVSCNIYVKTIRPVFRWAMRRELIEQDPFRNLNLFRVPKNRIRIYDPKECQQIAEACPTKLWKARVLLARTAGLRRGEVLNLTIGDVDFENGMIFIQPKKESSRVWRWSVKDIDRREVPLTHDLSILLACILDGLPEGQPYLMLSSARYRRLIQLKNAGCMSDRLRICPDENFTKPFNRILRFAGIKSGTFHDLRRTCITEWLENGLKPHEVMVLAGHSNIDTTMRYYVTTRRDLIDKARRASQNQANFGTFQSQTEIGVTGFGPATS